MLETSTGELLGMGWGGGGGAIWLGPTQKEHLLLQVSKRVGISQVEGYKRVGKSGI